MLLLIIASQLNPHAQSQGWASCQASLPQHCPFKVKLSCPAD